MKTQNIALIMDTYKWTNKWELQWNVQRDTTVVSNWTRRLKIKKILERGRSELTTWVKLAKNPMYWEKSKWHERLGYEISLVYVWEKGEIKWE